MKLKRAGDPREIEVEIVSQEADSIRARIDGHEVVAAMQPLPAGGAILTVNGRRYRVFGARRDESILIGLGPQSFELVEAGDQASRHARRMAAPEVIAPMPGKVLKVMVKEGDRVAAGDVLVVLEAMKMETTLVAEGDAIVKRVRVAEGAMVDHGAVLVELSPPPGPSVARSAPEEP